MKSVAQKLGCHISAKDKSTTQSSITACEFNYFFKSVFTNDDGVVPSLQLTDGERISDIYVSQKGIFNLLLKELCNDFKVERTGIFNF